MKKVCMIDAYFAFSSDFLLPVRHVHIVFCFLLMLSNFVPSRKISKRLSIFETKYLQNKEQCPYVKVHVYKIGPLAWKHHYISTPRTGILQDTCLF